MHVIDLQGNEYPLQATTTNEYEISGNQSITFRILPSKANMLFINDITEMWKVIDHDGITHKIIYLKKQGEGSKLSVEIKAIPKIFDDLDSQRIYERYDRHMTAQYCFNLIFSGSGYNFVLADTFDAQNWEGFGEGDTRLTLFKNALNRYGAEFRVVGNTIYIERIIGRDTGFMYRYRLNASNIVQENDANAYYTFARGYGDYGDGQGGEDWQEANLIREYTSPLASISGIGIRHAPPIKNGNITTISTMDSQLKLLVDESLKISVSATIHDLRNQGYAMAQPEMGDRVFLIDERIGLNDEVRVVNMSIVRKWKGEVLDIDLTLGSPGLVKRHQSNLQTAISSINSLIEGRMKLPFSVLDNAVAEATKALKRMESQLSITEDGSLMSVDKSNPNNLVVFNAAGIGVSNDGGITFPEAITGNGINASAMYTGILNADQVAIYGGDGESYTHIQGTTIELKGNFDRTWRDVTENHDVRTRLHQGHLRFRNDSADRSLYVSDFGISTAIDGSLDEAASGTLEFFSYDYSPTARGVTLHSHLGVVALKSEENRVHLESRRSMNLETHDSGIYLRPMKTSRPGTNEFIFRVKDNTWENTDGWISFGDVNTATYHSGLRFSKSSGRYTIYATDGEGNIGTGDFDANHFYGALRAKATHAYVLAAYDGELRVTDKNGYNNGNMNLRPVYALSFHTPSSLESFQGLYSLRSVPVKENESTEVVNSLNLIRYTDNGVPSYKIGSGSVLDTGDGDSIDMNKALMYTLKSLQEQSEEIEKLKGVN